MQIVIVIVSMQSFASAGTVNVRYNDARLSDNHDITTKSRKTVFLH